MNGSCEHTGELSAEASREDAAAGIAEGLDILVEETPALEAVARAFRGLLIERAGLKAELREPCLVSAPPPEPAAFERGAPLASIEKLIGMIDDAFWAAGAERLLPVIAESFPTIAKECETIGSALSAGRLDPRLLLSASLAGCEGEGSEAASSLGVSPQTLSFVLGQIARPMIEKISRSLSPLVDGLSWGRGCCPICGAMPELALLQAETGQRWLRCASCAHEWRFSLLTCPFCESRDHEDFEIYYVAGRECEYVEVCRKCMRYTPTVDMRKRPRPIARDVAAMALIPLDMVAQEKGFAPAAVSAWNIVNALHIEEDIFERQA